MDEARAVLHRLERIEALEREGANPAAMLAELRELVHEAEVWARLEGMDGLAYGPRTRLGGSYLPKIGIYWLWPTWTEAGTGQHPYDRDQKLDWPAPVERPPSIVHVDDVEATFSGRSRALGAAAG